MENNEAPQNNEDNNNNTPPTQYTSYLTLAKDFYRAKKYKKSLLYLSLYLKLHPLNYDALYLKCKIYIQLFQYNKAMVILAKASKITKENSTL